MSEPLKAVQAEADAPTEGVTVTLSGDDGDVDILVPPAGKWRGSANHALRQGDTIAWAESVLSDDDLDKWMEADPTNEQTADFFRSWAELSGENLSKSRASRRSSRSTPRR